MITVIIQARTGSTRLPGKVMKELCGKTVLAHDIERVSQAKLADEIIIATTTHDSDDVIVQEAEHLGVKVFRGSEDDVLSRYYFAAKEAGADVVARITSDCPLIDPVILDDVIRVFLDGSYDIVTNAGNDLSKRTFPRGLDAEVFSFEMLETAHLKAVETYQREHVTPYIYENAKSVFYYQNDVDYSRYRWTLDTEEDWQLISEIYQRLYHREHNFYFKDILSVMEENPELYNINKDIEQKKLK